jgi:CDP-diacylglycerol--serine O-phosphatidyltransferase
MRLIKQIPNFLTTLNLVCGFIAIVIAFNINTLQYAPYFIFLGACFDFVDGLAARMLKAYSDIGKQLDSLSDMVSFGIAPGVLIFQLLQISSFSFLINYSFIASVILSALIPIFSAWRLAKFNIDERQSTSFYGLPTPASAILIASLVLVVFFDPYSWFSSIFMNKYVLVALVVLDSILMICDIPMFSFKIKNLKIADNMVQFIFLLLSIVMLIIFKFQAIPLLILLYVLISLGIFSFSSISKSHKKDIFAR